MCVQIIHTNHYSLFVINHYMDNLELDKEIIETRQAIKELEESNDLEPLRLARADLSYFLSLLNN